MFFTELFKARHAGHGTVFIHDFADNPGRFHAGQACQIDRPLCLTGPDNNATHPRPEGENVTGPHKVTGLGIICHGG